MSQETDFMHDVDEEAERSLAISEAADGAIQAVKAYGFEFNGDDFVAFLAIVREGL